MNGSGHPRAEGMVPPKTPCSQWVLQHPGRFALHVFRSFRKNQGLLLSGAVAYYMLLSTIPLMMLLLVGLTQVFPEAQVLETVRDDLDLVMPTLADGITAHLRDFLANRHLIGWLGSLMLLFFATLTFTVLEKALSVIFFHRVAIHHRPFFVSALIPFFFIALIGLGLFLITLVNGAIQTLDEESIRVFGQVWNLGWLSSASLYFLGLGGLILLMTGFYVFMPPGRVSLSEAFITGTLAAVLWEISRHALVWYFTTLSLVNLIYGSFAGAVILLLSFEVAALILLFGAQIIAEWERCHLAESEDEPGFRT